MKKSLNIGIGEVIFIVFLILKLCGVITWSWWWVTAPIWIPIGIFVIAILLLALFSPSKLKDLWGRY